MIETIQLTPASTGLGDLHEVAMLALVADTHYRVLTAGTSVTPRGIATKGGEPLYPSIFALHVHVPVACPISSFGLWERLDVGADVRSFGRQFLEVNGVIGRPGEVPAATATWKELLLPRVAWSGAWTITRPGGEHELAMPDGQYLAELPRLSKVPAAILAAREASVRGSVAKEAAPAAPGVPIEYRVLAGRDAAIGRQLMFSQFVVIMDAAERAYLAEHVFPPFPVEVLEQLSTTERTIYYFGNCGAGDVIHVHVRAQLEQSATPDASHATTIVRSSMELVHAGTQRLLALAETRKHLPDSRISAGQRQAVERLFARHGVGTDLMKVPR